MEIFVTIAIVLLVTVIILISRKEYLHEAQEDLSEKMAERDEWHAREVSSYHDVTEIRKMLEKEIEESIDNEKKRVLLEEILAEWADLKVKTFVNRRSWLRTHGKSS